MGRGASKLPFTGHSQGLVVWHVSDRVQQQREEEEQEEEDELQIYFARLPDVTDMDAPPPPKPWLVGVACPLLGLGSIARGGRDQKVGWF